MMAIPKKLPVPPHRESNQCTSNKTNLPVQPWAFPLRLSSKWRFWRFWKMSFHLEDPPVSQWLTTPVYKPSMFFVGFVFVEFLFADFLKPSPGSCRFDDGWGQKLNRCVGAGKRKGAHLMLTQSTAKRIFLDGKMGCVFWKLNKT